MFIALFFKLRDKYCYFFILGDIILYFFAKPCSRTLLIVSPAGLFSSLLLRSKIKGKVFYKFIFLALIFLFYIFLDLNLLLHLQSQKVLSEFLRQFTVLAVISVIFGFIEILRCEVPSFIILRCIKHCFILSLRPWLDFLRIVTSALLLVYKLKGLLIGH